MEESLSPARKVVSRAPTKTVRVLNLAGILDAPIECESSLERDFVYRAVLCPGLAGLRHQPFRLQLGGRTYTPDFLVTHRFGHATVVEVKPASKVPKYRATFDAATRELASRGYSFAVLTEEAIRRHSTHQRAALILRYRKAKADADAIQRVVACLRNAGRLAGFLEVQRQCGVEPQVVMHLLATKTVITGADLPLDDEPSLSLFSASEDKHAIRIESWFGVAPWRAHIGADADAEFVGSSV